MLQRQESFLSLLHVGLRNGATSNSRKSDGRNKQTIGGKGPKSLSRQDVSGARELPKVLQTAEHRRAESAQNPLDMFPHNFPVDGELKGPAYV